MPPNPPDWRGPQAFVCSTPVAPFQRRPLQAWQLRRPRPAPATQLDRRRSPLCCGRSRPCRPLTLLVCFGGRGGSFSPLSQNRGLERLASNARCTISASEYVEGTGTLKKYIKILPHCSHAGNGGEVQNAKKKQRHIPATWVIS